MKYVLSSALAAAALLASEASASFTSGYSDNKCTVTISNVKKESSPYMGYTSADIVLVTYAYSCPDAIKYTRTGRQSKYGENPSYYPNAPTVDFAVTNSCMPDRFDGVTNPSTTTPPSYDEAKKSIVVRRNTYPNIVTCADQAIPMLDGIYATALPTKASLVTWAGPTDVTNAIAAGAEYNPADYTVTLPFGNRIIPGKTFTGSGSSWQDGDPSIDNMRWFAKIAHKDGKHFAIVHLLPGLTDNDYFNKPLVVGDAFDPFNNRGLTRLGSEEYQNLSKSAQLANLINSSGPRGKGYDLFFLDFSQGGGNIHINAGLELKFIEWMSPRAKSKIVVGGPSMSGVVARMALLYSQPAFNTTRTDLGKKIKGYISIDSPQQGASIAKDLQLRMLQLKDNSLVKFGEWFTGSNEPERNWKQFMTPAAIQMLYEHHFPDGSAPSAGHDPFYARLKAMGNYRGDIPSAAIAYSNFYLNWYPGDNVPVIGAQINPPGLDGRDVQVMNREFAAGSTGDWYWNSYKASSPGSMFPKPFGYGPEKFKGTFIPINSALDLTGDFNNTKPANHALTASTPFNFTYYMKSDYNGYCKTDGTCKQLNTSSPRQTLEDKRYVHIVFDPALVGLINNSLADIERSSRSLNNDKYDDLLFFAYGGMYTETSNGTGLAYAGQWASGIGTYDKDYLYLGDFNGDGQVDMGYQTANDAFQVALSNGAGFGPLADWIIPGNWGNRGGKINVGDFNGDGKDDLLFFQPGGNGSHVTLSTGTGFNGAGSGKWIADGGFGTLKDNFMVGDFNGDGVSDVAHRDNLQNYIVKLSTKTGFGATINWIPSGYFGNNAVHPYVGDFSGDGRDDFLFFNKTNGYLLMSASTGSGVAAAKNWAGTNVFGNVATNYHPADFNGDGICDLGRFDGNDNTFHVKMTNAAGTGFGASNQWVGPNGFGHSDGRFMTTYRKKRIVIN